MSPSQTVTANSDNRRAFSFANPPRWFEPAALFVILVATFVSYWPSLHGQSIWDDDHHITSRELQSFHGLCRIWFELGATQQYYPLLFTAFWAEHKLWGDSVLGYHLINVVFHMVTVSLVYFVLKKLKVPGALLATAIFALHPVMVESVAWISEQKNTLSAVFYFGAILAYLNFDKSRERPVYLLALALYLAALLSKSATVTLAPALLIIFWWQRGTLSLRRDVVPLLPFLVIGVASGLLTSWVERSFLGAEGARFAFSPIQRFLLAGRAVWFYLMKLVWPTNLLCVYPRWQIDPAVWRQWVFPLAALTLTVLLWFARHRSRAPLAAWLYFCATLFPVLGFFNVSFFVYSFVADHFQYLAGVGLMALAAAGVTRFLVSLPPPARMVCGAICLGGVVVLAALAFQQNRLYADRFTFYQYTIDRNPACWMAHNNLGLAFQQVGDRQKAIEHFNKALEIKPDYASAEYNLATILSDGGQLEAAIPHFQAALRLRPTYVEARNNFGNTLLKAGQAQAAIDEFKTVLTLKPDTPLTLDNLGIAMWKLGRGPEATDHFQRAVQLEPNDAACRLHLAVALAQLNKIPEAIEQFSEVVKLAPQRVDARNDLGLLLARSGRIEEAITQFEQAIQIQPKSLLAYSNLAQTLAAAHRAKAAIVIAQKGIEVARATSQEPEAKKLEELLNAMQSRLRSEEPTTSVR